MNFQDIIVAVGSISGLLSGVYLVISKLREGPRVSLSVDSCRYEKSDIRIAVTLRKRGTISTSLESVELMTKQDKDYVIQTPRSLLDISKLRRLEESYVPNRPPPLPQIHMPFLVENARTLELLALFQKTSAMMNETEFELKVTCTHKVLKEKWVGEFSLAEGGSPMCAYSGAHHQTHTHTFLIKT